MNFAFAVLAAITLIQPGLSAAGDNPNQSGTKPSSFAPRAHTNQHVYGSPIEPAIVGHAKNSHPPRAPKRQPSGAATRAAR